LRGDEVRARWRDALLFFTHPPLGFDVTFDRVGPSLSTFQLTDRRPSVRASRRSGKNYNSFPEAPEVMRTAEGTFHVIRKKQSLEQITANEVELPDDAC
jgi:hypothetical protein